MILPNQSEKPIKQLNLDTYIAHLFGYDKKMARMGHGQSMADNNLGLGWIYYALARAYRVEHALVIGSLRGFVPSVIARALLDNEKSGRVSFVDPSLADDFWSDPKRVQDHFHALGTPNVTHYRYTTQEFIQTLEYARLDSIGLLMIDGWHTAEQARLDYLAFLPKLNEQAVVLFHDSTSKIKTGIYGKEKAYRHTVHLLIERLEETAGLQVFTFPVSSGVTLVSGKPETLDIINQAF